jgi:hypothetical protein
MKTFLQLHTRAKTMTVVTKTAILFVAFLVCARVGSLFPQSAAKPATANEPAPAVELEKLKADQERTKAATEVAREWFRRLNALDGSKEAIDRFVELYQPDAVQIASPRGEDQIGPSYFEGADMIRKFAERTSKDYTRIAYFIRQRTVNNKTAELMVANVGAFGDVTMALEFSGSVNVKNVNKPGQPSTNDAPKADSRTGDRATSGATGDSSKEKRFTVPGAAFIDVRNGKISRIRIIYASGESFPVSGNWILSL